MPTKCPQGQDLRPHAHPCRNLKSTVPFFLAVAGFCPLACHLECSFPFLCALGLESPHSVLLVLRLLPMRGMSQGLSLPTFPETHGVHEPAGLDLQKLDAPRPCARLITAPFPR